MNHAGSGPTHSAAPAAGQTAPNTWPPSVLAGVERELARFVGPLAATLVRRAAQQHETIETLIAALLPSIEGQQDRDAFTRTCSRRAVMRHAPPPAPSAPASLPPAPPTPTLAASPADAAAPPGRALLQAAEPLLGLLPRLRGMAAPAAPADPAALQAQLLQRLAAFEAEATAHGEAAAHIASARSLLCHFVDEVLGATPWGAQGLWAAHALAPASQAQARTASPDPLLLMQRALAEPAAHAPLFELFHVCIALGFEGGLRNTPQVHAELEALSTRLHALLPTRRGSARAPRTLSPHWRGLATRGHRDLSALPLWALVAFGAALLLALWLALNARLDARARPVFARLAAVPAALQGPGAVTAARPRLAAALPADARIDVRDEARRSLVTLPADSLFVADSARLDPHAGLLLSRVAQALRSQIVQGAEVSVIGHGDDAPMASLQFPTGWHLTRARAQAVADALVAQHVAPVRAEGRAEFEPRAPNSTESGRAQNRRIEIELRLPRPEEVGS